MHCLHRPPVLNGSFTMFCFRYPRNCSPLSVLESTTLCHLLLTKSSRSVWSSSKYCSTWNTLFTRRKMPLTNRVPGPYRKLRTELFSFGFMAQALGARVIKNRIPWLTVWTEKNEVGKIFIISLDSIGVVKDFYSSGIVINDWRASNPKYKSIGLVSNKNWT